MIPTKKTKIIATLGPASESPQTIKELILNGVNVFRFNMKHGTIAWHQENIKKVQSIANKLNVNIGILIDLQGPEIRIQTNNIKEITLKRGDTVKFATDFNNNINIKITHKSVFKALNAGDYVFLDDGFVQLKVVEASDTYFAAKALEDAVLKDKKSVNLFGKDLKLPSLIKDDIERLSIATTHKVDYVALSFSRTKKDILTLKKLLKAHNIDAQIVAKIESQAAINNIDELIQVSDVIMIARGDLGIETPIEKLALYQKEIINKCRIASKTVIVATQMLESMINNPIPTRAEATDVANAVLDGTDCLMLSGETAVGKYPVQSVKAMAKIAQYNETATAKNDLELKPDNATEFIVEAAKMIEEHSKQLKLDYIIVLTETGYTAKVLASYRPAIKMYAATHSLKTVETLTMAYGVYPVKVVFPQGKILSVESIIKQMKTMNYLKEGDNILLIHGQHWNKPGQTNSVNLLTVE